MWSRVHEQRICSFCGQGDAGRVSPLEPIQRPAFMTTYSMPSPLGFVTEKHTGQLIIGVGCHVELIVSKA